MKMEPLVTNRRYLVWLCMCPASKSTSRWQEIAHATFAITALTGLVSILVPCTVFFWKFISIDMGRCMFALVFIVAEFVAVYTALVGMISLRHKVGTIFDNLAKIYKDSKCLILKLYS